MIFLTFLITASSSALMLLLGAAAWRHGGGGLKKALLILTALVQSAAMLFLTLTLASRDPQNALRNFEIFIELMIVTPAFVVPFFFFLGRGDGIDEAGGRAPGMIILGVLLAAAAVLAPLGMILSRIHFMENGYFWGVEFGPAGKGLAAFFLIVNVLLLHSAENTYRRAGVAAKVALKYPMLGMIAALVMNFTVMSRVLSLSALDHNFIAAGAAGLIFFSVSFIYAISRYELLEIRVHRPREGRASIISVVVAGLYFLAVALISWISASYGMSFDRFSAAVLGAFALFVVLAAAISGRVRRRVRRFVVENFRPGRYNYRREWRRYARLMAGSNEIDEFLSNTISSLCETVMVRKGLAWADFSGDRVASYGLVQIESLPRAARIISGLYSGEPVRFIDDKETAAGGDASTDI